MMLWVITIPLQQKITVSQNEKYSSGMESVVNGSRNNADGMRMMLTGSACILITWLMMKAQGGSN